MDTPDPPPRPTRWSVGRVVMTYLVVGLAWILFSTPLAGALGEAVGLGTIEVELGKGVLFVVLTAGALYVALRRWESAYHVATQERQRDLEVRERRFRNLAEETEGAVYRFRFDPGWSLDYMSPQFEEMTGFTAEQVREDPGLLARQVDPAHRDRLAFVGVVDPGAGSHEPGVMTFRFLRADGHWIWLEDHHTPEVGRSGRVEADQGIVFDVTARRREEEARAAALAHERAAAEHLRRTVDAHRSFLSSVSHELRTPLTSVLGLAETLRSHDAELSPATREDLLQRLRANANRLGRLLDDLLDLDRVERGVLEVNRADVDLAAMVATIVGELEAPDHRVVVDLPVDPVRVDRPKAERIVDNLLRNAVRHTPPGSTVWVRAEPAEAGVVLVVEDDGPGVEGDPDAMFAPFRQGPRASASASPGTGIGLALVRQFARLHGGDAWYEDRRPTGARFSVLLPDDG